MEYVQDYCVAFETLVEALAAAAALVSKEKRVHSCARVMDEQRPLMVQML